MSDSNPSPEEETTPSAETSTEKQESNSPGEVNHPNAHWRACLKITFGLLLVWFVVSFGAAILLRDWLDTAFPKIGNAPFGFWMAQQGSIICFVIILIVYARLMNQLDRKHGYSEE